MKPLTAILFGCALAAVVAALAIVAHDNGQRWGDTATVALSTAADGASDTLDDLGDAANARQQALFEAEQRRLDTLAWQQVHATETAVAVIAERERLATAATATALAEQQAAAALPTSTASTGLSPWALLPWVLLLVISGASGAGVVYLWRVATGATHTQVVEVEALRTQAQVETERARHQHALPPATYAPHISNTVAPHYAPHDARRMELPRYAEHQAAQPEQPEQPATPGAVDLAALDFVPTPQRLLLAVGPGGEPITVPLDRLMHVATAGSTGSGKSNTFRLLMGQLLHLASQPKASAGVCFINPHYAPTDDSGLTWQPLAERLYMPVASGKDDIAAMLDYFVSELDRRIEQARRATEPPRPRALFLFIDELPVVTGDNARAMDTIARLVREGRKYRLYCATAAQDYLIKSVGGSTGVRDGFRTAYYGGGDRIGAAALLDIPQRQIDDGSLSEPGLVLLRSASSTPPVLARVPYVSNEAIAKLLPERLEPPGSYGAQAHNPETTPEPAVVPAHNATEPQQQLSPQERQILQMAKAGHGMKEIVQTVYGKSGSRYSQYASEVMRVLAAHLPAVE